MRSSGVRASERCARPIASYLAALEVVCIPHRPHLSMPCLRKDPGSTHPTPPSTPYPQSNATRLSARALAKQRERDDGSAGQGRTSTTAQSDEHQLMSPPSTLVFNDATSSLLTTPSPPEPPKNGAAKGRENSDVEMKAAAAVGDGVFTLSNYKHNATPVAGSSTAASSQAGGTADNRPYALPVSLTSASLGLTPTPHPPGNQESTLAWPNVNARFYLTDVQIERIDIDKEGLLPLNLTELRVSPKPGQGSEGETVFSLSEISSRRWELTDFIAFPGTAEGIQCTIKGSEGEDVASVYFDCNEIGGGKQPVRRRSKDMDPNLPGGGVCLIFWWDPVDTAPDDALPADGHGMGGRGTKDMYSSQKPSLPTWVAENLGGLQKVLPSLRSIGCDSIADDFTALRDCASESMRLFKATGDFTHVEDAFALMETWRQALWERLSASGTLFDKIDEAATLLAHGDELSERFKVTGDVELAAESIAVRKRALQLVPDDHILLPEALHNLSVTLHRHYDHTGDLSHLAEAISIQRRAITLTPDEDLPDRLHTLGNLLRLRFSRTGEPSDLDEGLSAHQRAVQLGSENHPLLPSWLNGVGNAFCERFNLSGDLSDLDEAISAQRRAVSLTPEGHEDLPGRLNNLGIYLLEGYQTTRNLPDLNEAISAHQRSVQLTPDGHPHLPSWFNNLGISLMRRFLHTCDPSDIAQAISADERAVALTSTGHSQLPCRLENLGIHLFAQWTWTRSQETLRECLSALKSASTGTCGAPKSRLKAARTWLRFLNEDDPMSSDILLAFDFALSLLALIGGLEQTVQGRHSQLRDVSGMSLEAAAAALTFGHPDKALEFLEQGRCLVWTQLNSLRTPLDSLRSHDRQLANRVTKVSAQLEHAGSSRRHAGSTTSLHEKLKLEDEALEHVNLAKQWDSLLEEVRSKPGFETFLQPPTSATLLQHLPESGAVVVINVDKKRCDAIALMAGLDEPLHIPLPNFSLEKANTYREDLRHRRSVNHIRVRDAGGPDQEVDCSDERAAIQGPIGSRKKPVRDMAGVLRGLWVGVVKPILEALAFTKLEPSSDKPAPRIWWCPTGPLSFLPLHAAGIYSAGAAENILDYVVSSYTPTVTSLTERFKGDRPIDKDVSGLFLTCQPNATGCTPIPGTAIEVDDISSMAKSNGIRVLKLAGAEVSGQDCVKRMEEFSSVHLACHASQYAAEPLKSRFSFHNDRLELSTILQSNLKNADLAFLSACQTSVGEETLADEAVHLAAGMLAAGYRRVVATMWSINDVYATKLAKSFYQYLWDHPTEASRDGGFDGTLSAYALHHAIQELRRELGNDSEGSLLTWVPFVHFGY
ncbi:hypothetical protein NMY22_g6647 [Coprinellus aureogranulatus]|nr:hypothetical protein NMY22_g6647 [Coprinellus aureogranulatus]